MANEFGHPVPRWWSPLLVVLAVVTLVACSAGGTRRAESVPASVAGSPAVEPLTDAQWAAHVQDVDTRITDALRRGQATNVTFTQDGDGVHWLPSRVQQQQKIAEELYARGALVPDEGKAVFTGGLPGAGKTTALAQNPEIDPTRFVVANDDDAKDKMCEHGMIPAIEGLAPLETSDLIQAESAVIAKMVAALAYREHKNVIWDTTMSSGESLQQRLAAVREAGYHYLTVLFLDVPIEVSVQRVDQRHRQGYEKFRNGDRCSGRHVPARIIRANADPEYSSVNRRVFEQTKAQFDRWYLYDASHIPPTLINHN